VFQSEEDFITMSSYGNENRGDGVAAAADVRSEGRGHGTEFVGPSLCIPRTHSNIRKERIFAVFRALNLGWVGRIDVVPKINDDGSEFVRVFIHFTKWFGNHQSRQFLQRLESEGHARIVYDEPWYWKVTKSTAPPPPEFKPKPQLQSRYPRPRIDFVSSDKVATSASSGASAGVAVAVVQPIVPVQVTRHVRSVSSGRGSCGRGSCGRGGRCGGNGDGDDEKSKSKQYWNEQAELMLKSVLLEKFEKLSPTPKSSDSVSPHIKGDLSVKLFD
jgi:hypothetical protein